MQLFSADATIFSKKKLNSFFAHENIKNRPQKFFFTVLLSCPNQPRIDFSYYEYVPRFICLLICDHNEPIEID